MPLSRGAAVACLALGLGLTWTSLPARAQNEKGGPGRGEKGGSALKTTGKERVSGVIVKIEKVARDPSEHRTEEIKGVPRPLVRLTINMNAVWRDWARDQAREKDTGPARKDAKAGSNSVATKGEPLEQNSLVVVDVNPETNVQTRFRAADDEAEKGAKTPEGAGAPKSHASAKPVRFRVEDLKAGLFVEADYRHLTGRNPASAVTVIRPIGGPDTPAGVAVPNGSR